MEFTQLLTPEFKDWDPQVHCLILLPLQRKISLLPWKQALFFNAGVIATKFFLFSLNLCILEVLSESTSPSSYFSGMNGLFSQYSRQAMQDQAHHHPSHCAEPIVRSIRLIRMRQLYI